MTIFPDKKTLCKIAVGVIIVVVLCIFGLGYINMYLVAK